MKVAILTQYYPPEHGAPQNRLHDLSKRWAESGVDVQIITAMPNYPGGEVFKDYRGKFIFSETIDGVKVLRSWIKPSKDKGIVKMLICYFSFVFSSFIAGIFKMRKVDFLICESPPLFLGFTAIALKYIKGTRLITNISDLWPESAVQLGMIKPGPALTFLEWFEKFLYKKSALVSCQTEGIVNGVKKTSSTSETFLFPNGVDLEMFSKCEKNQKTREEFNLPEESLIIGYGGNHGRSQALGQVLDAAEILKNEKVFFALFGDGPEKDGLISEAKKRNLENVGFYPSQARQKMNAIQSMWDLALVPLKNIDLFDGARPSKMFELMAGEIPFIFCGKGEGADLAVKSGCAFAVAPESPGELASAIQKFISMSLEERKNMGVSGRKFVAAHFDRSKIAAIFLQRLEKILSDR